MSVFFANEGRTLIPSSQVKHIDALKEHPPRCSEEGSWYIRLRTIDHVEHVLMSGLTEEEALGLIQEIGANW